MVCPTHRDEFRDEARCKSRNILAEELSLKSKLKEICSLQGMFLLKFFKKCIEFGIKNEKKNCNFNEISDAQTYAHFSI